MRYAALNFGTGMRPIAHLSSYAGFVPNSGPNAVEPARLSDEHLYALARYIYSLRPPASPYPMNAAARIGERVFAAQGCGGCHPPPFYTNNKLTPAEGFAIPPDDLKRFSILPVNVGTDPWLAMKTRRGTGYYKVPSLKGVWYRGPLEHNGSVLTLEDWFDPRRLRDDYEPTGWTGPSKHRAVKGHEFGLRLAEKDRSALIAFLRTL
jgi:CxxC motif-containing protein (DUF1111 family)